MGRAKVPALERLRDPVQEERTQPQRSKCTGGSNTELRSPGEEKLILPDVGLGESGGVGERRGTRPRGDGLQSREPGGDGTGERSPRKVEGKRRS